LKGSAPHFHRHYGTTICIAVLRFSYDCTKSCASWIHSTFIHYTSEIFTSLMPLYNLTPS
jgi:hypothetical protein